MAGKVRRIRYERDGNYGSSFPLTTQGQLSAVGIIVSAGYGFICGAYMPISNFGSGLDRAILTIFRSVCYLPISQQEKIKRLRSLFIKTDP